MLVSIYHNHSIQGFQSQDIILVDGLRIRKNNSTVINPRDYCEKVTKTAHSYQKLNNILPGNGNSDTGEIFHYQSTLEILYSEKYLANFKNF